MFKALKNVPPVCVMVPDEVLPVLATNVLPSLSKRPPDRLYVPVPAFTDDQRVGVGHVDRAARLIDNANAGGLCADG